MIIFYNKKGLIKATLDGRIHSKDELGVDMYMDEKKKDKLEKLVVNWKPCKWYNKEGKEVNKKDKDVYTSDFKPDTDQEDIFRELDKDSKKVYKYKIKKNKLEKI